MERARILVVEDEPIVAESIKNSLEDLGYEVLGAAETAEEALQKTREYGPDLVLMDISLGGPMDGIEAAQEIRSHHDTPVVYLTAYAEDEILDRAKATSAYGYILKPYKDKELHSAIQMALHRQNMEAKLRESEETNRILFEALPQRIFYKDCNSVYLACNDLYARDLGILPDTIPGMTDYAFYPHELAEKYREDDRRILSSGETESIEEKYCRDGEELWVQTVKTPIRDENGDLKGLLGVFWDISERKRAEEELRRYREKLEQLVDERTVELRGANHRLEEEIAERNRIEEALRESERRYRLLAETTSDVIWTTDLKLMPIYVSPSIMQLRGYTPDEAMSHGFEEIFTPATFETAKKIYGEELAGEAIEQLGPSWSPTFELEMTRKDSTTVWTETRFNAMLDEDGQPIGIMGVARDITERKEAEERLRKSEARLAEAQRIAHMGNWDWNLETNGLFWSEEVYRIFGLAPGQFGTNQEAFLSLVHPEDKQSVEDSVVRALKREEPYSSDHRIILPDGSERVVHEEAEVTFDEAGRPIRMAGTVQDITPHKKAEKRILWQNALLTGIKHVLEETLTCNSEEEVAHKCLDVAEKLTGSKFGFVGEVNEKGLFDTLAVSDPGWDACKIPESNAVAMIRNMEIRGVWGSVLKDEKSMIVNDPSSHPDSVGTPAGHLAITSFLGVPLKHKDKTMGMIALGNKERGYSRDDLEAVETLSVSFVEALMRKRTEQEKQKIQDRLQLAEKMESIGTLAGGIAHDFNNILQVILGYAELAFQDSESNPDLQGILLELINAGKRGKDLASQILTFSRQSEQDRNPTDIRIVLREAMKFLRSSLPTTIEIREDVQVESASILGDSTQIHQVLVNLCTNAAQAMSEQGGLLEISLTAEFLNAAAAKDDPDLKPGPYLKLTVADTGHGMDRAVMERMFDPFFTTKSPGEGTGMGLAVVHGIVKKHGGAISVSSEPGKGTKFFVLLPLLESQVALDSETAGALLVGKGRILFVDDEVPIVNLARKMLERLGYAVTGKASSIEALEDFRAQPDRFDLVITDMTMPKMTGVDLTKELLRIRPGLPIILCTGFSEAIDPRKASELGFRRLLMKPVLLEQLNEAIREVLH